MDCPALAEEFNTTNPDSGAHDPVLTCNAYIKSDPKAMEEAYWKIRGVYVFERAWEREKMVIDGRVWYGQPRRNEK